MDARGAIDLHRRLGVRVRLVDAQDHRRLQRLAAGVQVRAHAFDRLVQLVFGDEPAREQDVDEPVDERLDLALAQTAAPQGAVGEQPAALELTLQALDLVVAHGYARARQSRNRWTAASRAGRSSSKE